MDAVAYPNVQLSELVAKHVIPLRLPPDIQLADDDFTVVWTPAFYILDSDGYTHHCSTGFLTAQELMPWIILGKAKVYFDKKDPDKALPFFASVIKDYPDSKLVPEAIFYNGVSEYLKTHDGAPLKAVYETLSEKYPDSIWAEKAQPYRLL